MNTITLSTNMQNLINFQNLSVQERFNIIKIVGTKTKSGKVKSALQLNRDCFDYFTKNILNK